MSLHLGCASREIPVPLFTELYGYGPFLGRRNRGILDPLHCRVASFRDGVVRLIIISNDLVTMDPGRVQEVRTVLCQRLGMPPECIMICGSHTHSGPTISPGIGWGELNPQFVETWKETAVATALDAVADECPATLTVGSVPLSQPLGYNRVSPGGPTDPDIRWICCRDESGGTKLLIHNHGMHGVVFGSKMLLVSADWPGAVNQRIIDAKLAHNVLFLQGPAGNINTKPCCVGLEEGRPVLADIAEKYVAGLSAGLQNGTDVSASPLSADMVSVSMPCRDVDPEFLRKTAAQLREVGGMAYQSDRMEEMAIYMEAGGETDITAAFQVLRIGDICIYAVPGELFVELGMQLLARSPGKRPLIATLANDNLRYIPTPEAFAANPEIVTEKRGYGYYETQFTGYGRFRSAFKPNVGPFLVERMLGIATGLFDR